MSEADLNLQKVVCGKCGCGVPVALCPKCGWLVEEGDVLEEGCIHCLSLSTEPDVDAEYHRRIEEPRREEDERKR